MRVGLISDVHANLVALEAVLDAMPPVEEVWCAGDVIGYNPWPAACVERTRETCSAVVQGNHDRTVRTPERFSANRMAYAGLAYAKAELSAEQLAWLDDLPRECVIDGRFLLVHDHPRVRDRYVYPQEFSAIAESVDYDAVILGHTHVQGAETADGTLVVNPGSVGQPRDRDPRAAFAVLDTETVEVDLHRVEYDVERVREAITNAGIPERTGERLLTGG
jgi:putative phosphoesterase